MASCPFFCPSFSHITAVAFSSSHHSSLIIPQSHDLNPPLIPVISYVKVTQGMYNVQPSYYTCLLALYSSIYILCSFQLLLHYISEEIHLFDS